MTPAILLAASGTGQGFDSVVRGIETRYHARATRIPFLGLMSGIARISTHGGVHNMHIAEFENFKGDGDGPIDGDELLRIVQEHAGEGWHRMIRETSRSGDEQSLIYIRAEGSQVGMLVVDLGGNDLNVVQISMNPDRLMEQLKAHEHPTDHDANSDPARDQARDPARDPARDTGFHKNGDEDQDGAE